MSTIKLHEATKEFKIANKFAMFLLEKLGMPVKSHSSVLTSDMLETLREYTETPKKYAAVSTAFEKAEKEKKASRKKSEEAEIRSEPEAIPTPAAEQKSAAVEPAPTAEVTPAIAVETETRVAPPKTERKEPEPETGAAKTPAPPANKPPAPRPAEIKPMQPPVEKKPVDSRPPEPRPMPRPPEPKPAPPRVQIMDKPRADQGRKMPQPGHHQPPQGQYRRPYNSNRGDQRRMDRPQTPRPVVPAKPKEELLQNLPASIQVADYTTPRELAEKLGCKLRNLEEKMEQLHLDFQNNQFMDLEILAKLSQEINVKIDILPYEEYIFRSTIEQNKSQLKTRPAVVTVMGHVDHGKTTLLDTLRKTRVAEKEAGGITQKIGAYKLAVADGAIIFIDTPGHEAFTALRARGASVTDIVILVVAANDGVQPQTIEAINHALVAKVPIIVAVNKIDLAGADPTKVKQALTKHNILVEEWGGNVVSVDISAKMNQNLDHLLEMIQLLAQMQELKAYDDIPARGVIIEARHDAQLGPLATVLIQHGHLQRGDFFICGNAVGKIKTIFSDSGKTLNAAGVSDPIEIMGFEDLPQAGDIFQIVTDEEKARRVIDNRRMTAKTARNRDIQAEKKLSLQNLFQLLEQNKIQVFPLIIKADSYGSVEVLGQLIEKLSQEKLKIEVIHSSVGNITESDIMLATTANAVILGFNVKAPGAIPALAKRENVDIRLYTVIYHLVEELEKAIKGMIKPEKQETRIGTLDVLQKFKITKIGFIAGCMVKDGRVTRNAKVKVMRRGDLVFEGNISTLRHFQNEASEVKAGSECGIHIKNFNNIEIGDTLEIYETTYV